MAAARPLVGRNSVTENVIKQGYLKRSVRSSDIILSATKQLASNIKQKFEPSRWYVFGVRYGTPYLEYFESEERVFSSSPMESFDLSSYRSLTYTLGRTNSNFTFCIFLEERTIELTALNRAQMLDWCRNLERHLRNLGIGNKKAKDDHTYSAFPVQPKPPRRSSIDSLEGATGADANLDDENIYEEADTLVKDVNHNNQGVPALPPRSTSNEDESVFASIYSVKKLPDNEYNNVEGLEAEGDGNCDVDDNPDTCSFREEAVSVDMSYLHGQTDSVRDEEEDDRCSSMPVIPSKHQEQDTSEDSDFVSASFWLRNRKLEGAKSHDDSDLDIVKRKLPSLPQEQGEQVPPLPRRHQSMRPSSGRNCLSMNLDPQLNSNKNMTISALYQTPVPTPRGEKNSKLNRNQERHENEVKEKVSQRSLVKDINEQKIDNKFQGSCDTKAHSVSEYDSDDGGAYEALVNAVSKKKPFPPDDNTIYETTWGSKSGSEKSSELESDICKPPLKESVKEVGQDPQPLLPPRKGLSKFFKSKIDKPLPDELVVSLPARESCKVGLNPEEEEQDAKQLDGNLYSDFPESLETPKSNGYGSKRNSFRLDSDVIKSSAENGAKLDNQTSPVLPRRVLNTRATSVKLPQSGKGQLSKNPLSQSVSESRSNYYESPTSPDMYKSHNGSLEYLKTVPSNTGSQSNGMPLEESSSQPVAPPRRSRKKDQDSQKTVIACTQSSFESAPTLPVRNISLSSYSFNGEEPPLPPRNDSLPERHAPPIPTDRPAPPLPLVDSIPEKPAPAPPLRRSVIRSQSEDKPEQPLSGARPKTTYHVTRSTSHVGMNLKQNQVDILKAERDSTGGMVRTIPKVHFLNGLALVQCFDAVWIAGWDVKKYPRLYDKFHIGDELISINDVQVVDLAFAQKLVKNIKVDHVEVTVRRLPNARIYAIQRSHEGESLGIKRDGGSAEIVYVDPHGLAARNGMAGKANTMSGGGLCNWTLTEINMRPLNLFFKDNEIEHRLLAVGRDISIVVQPSDFIKELRKQLKKMRGFKDYIVQ